FIDGGETTNKMAGGGGGGGAGINTSNVPNTTGGYGGASAGTRTARSLSNAAAAVSGALPFANAEPGDDCRALSGGITIALFGRGGGAGGATAKSFADAYIGPCFGGHGGQFGGGGGAGAGYTDGQTVANDGFAGGDGIAIVITTF